jgi:hypothetical protein
VSALRGRERAWAEALLGAIVGPTEEHGMPSFASVDLDAFYRAIDTAPGPSFAPGLRAIVYGLTFLPLADRRFGKPFYALAPDARVRCIEVMAAHELYAVRQMVSTLKILACFAYFEDGRVRARSREALG